MDRKSIFARNKWEVLIGALLLIALYLVSQQNYLLFHTLIELFTIIVAAGIFVIAWNARRYINNNFLLFIGIASVFIAFLDLLHTLAYEGMAVFPGDTSDLATQLWVAGRYVQGVSWLIAPLFLGRKLRLNIQIVAYAFVTCLLLLSILYWRDFPAAYVEGAGLTTFKKVSEFVISLIFVGSIALLLRKRQDFDPLVWRLVILSLILTIGAEIAFTSYVSVYGGSNLVGHLLRLIAFYVLYKAIIETGLVKPYAILLRDLKRSDDQLREYAATLQTQNGELIRTEDQLRRDQAALEARNLELDTYAHTVAHDLKNPLAAIIAASDVITEVGNLTHKEQREYLLQIKATAFEMNGIIDSLLLLSELRSVEAPMEAVDMARVLSRVRSRLKYLAREYRGRLTCPEEWPTALGYEPWIEEIWANYISNALKYGGPSPRVTVGATVQPDSMIRFWTRDEGPGISAEVQANLFTPFTLLNKKKGGHGLGLSIVLRIVEKLGGQVGVQSEPGKGSLFYFSLPAAGAEASSSEPSKQTAPEMA